MLVSHFRIENGVGSGGRGKGNSSRNTEFPSESVTTTEKEAPRDNLLSSQSSRASQQLEEMTVLSTSRVVSGTASISGLVRALVSLGMHDYLPSRVIASKGGRCCFCTFAYLFVWVCGVSAYMVCVCVYCMSLCDVSATDRDLDRDPQQWPKGGQCGVPTGLPVYDQEAGQ